MEVVLGESLVLSPILVSNKVDPYLQPCKDVTPLDLEKNKAPFPYKDLEEEH